MLWFIMVEDTLYHWAHRNHCTSQAQREPLYLSDMEEAGVPKIPDKEKKNLTSCITLL